MRESYLPFSKPSIGEEEIAEVEETLRSGWITTGPRVQEFERAFAEAVGCRYALAVNSATAGLHLALLALDLKPGDEVITTPMTFASTVNAILLAGGTPVLADIDRTTFNIDPKAIKSVLSPRTKGLVPVHFAGLSCDMDALRTLASEHGLWVLEDAAHAIGTEYKGQKIGSRPSPWVVFSFHPTKNITTGEGGMVCTDDEELAEKIAVLRQNGMSKGAWNRYAATGTPHYDIVMLGLKYNMLDIEAAIGIHQLPKLERFLSRREEIVQRYKEAFSGLEGLILPKLAPYPARHSWHIFTPLVDIDRLDIDRDGFMSALKERNIGSALHYQALHLMSYYQKRFGWHRGLFPNAEYVSDRILSLPLFPEMTAADVEDVIEAVVAVCRQHLQARRTQ